MKNFLRLLKNHEFEYLIEVILAEVERAHLTQVPQYISEFSCNRELKIKKKQESWLVQKIYK